MLIIKSFMFHPSRISSFLYYLDLIFLSSRCNILFLYLLLPLLPELSNLLESVQTLLFSPGCTLITHDQNIILYFYWFRLSNHISIYNKNLQWNYDHKHQYIRLCVSPWTAFFIKALFEKTFCTSYTHSKDQQTDA